jgi:excisionase family DNA binding protein
MLSRRFLTVREVADLAQVGEATVRHWIKAGDLRAIDVGREWRVIPRDFEEFIGRHATRSETRAQPAGEPPQAP